VLGPPRKLSKPVGCRSCSGTGYRGRIALHEVMPMSERLEELTIKHAPAHDLKAVAVEEGMCDLRTDGLAKAAEGQTSIAEVLRVAI
jgi:type IV pilus assembly protein PilB